jgi:hypothetical protein
MRMILHYSIERDRLEGEVEEVDVDIGGRVIGWATTQVICRK